MEDFKQYLSEDSDASERAAAKEVLEGLAGLRLEKKVAEVAAERRAWLQRRFWGRVAVGAALVIVASVAFLLLWKKEKSATAPQPSQLQQQAAPQPPIANEPPLVNPQEKRKNEPIAKIKPSENLPSPRFPAPNIRGENSDNPAWKALLDQVWYTDYGTAGPRPTGVFSAADQLLKARDFNTAYIRLQRLEKNLPENDTLLYLKGYCLLEMGEESEALNYFEKLQGRQPNWESSVQWYRGLSLLLTGDQEKALTVFRKIAASPRHPYRARSERAITILK